MTIMLHSHDAEGNKMARQKEQITYAHAPMAAVEQSVEQLGRNIAVARLRRGLRQQDLATKAGITRATLVGIEKGKLGTGIGAYVSVLRLYPAAGKRRDNRVRTVRP
jgi:DNA-binding XRE family transcriptional regulator